MVWGTAADFVESYTRRGRPAKCLKASKSFSRNELPRQGMKSTALQLFMMSTVPRPLMTLTAQRSRKKRPPLMVQLSSPSKQRSERRISVRLPLKVRGRDRRGVTFEEDKIGRAHV